MADVTFFESQPYYPQVLPSASSPPLPMVLDDLPSPPTFHKFSDPPIVYQRRIKPPIPAASMVPSQVDTTTVSPSPRAFLEKLAVLDAPKTYEEASRHYGWQIAVEEEMAALQANGTCTLGSLRAGY